MRSSLVAQSCCSALSASLVLAVAVAEGLLCFFGSRGGGREVDLRLGEDQPLLLLSLQVLRWRSKHDCLQCNTGCLERRSSQAVLRGSRLRLEEAGSTILIVSWSTRRAFSCPHRALKAP